MSTVSFIRQMVDAGFSYEDALKAAEIYEANQFQGGDEPVLTKRQARNKRYYERLKSSEKHLNKTVKTFSDGGDPSPPLPLSSPPTPPPIIPHTSTPSSSLRSEITRAAKPDLKAEFDREFWPTYPNKVGKPEGLKSFVRARSKAELGEIMAGLHRYVAKTDDRAWCNPATWLNQERWNDQPALVPRGQSPPQVGADGLARDAQGRVSMADYTSQILRKMEQQGHDGRTIEGSYERRDGDGTEPSLPLLGA